MSTVETAPEDEAPEPRDPNAVTIHLDGREVEARKGEWIIAAADRADVYIPRFCYHPRMDPVGMCRQCMVEVEGPRGPMMVVSCMTPVADGQIVRTDTPQVRRAQEGMLELLLANHPLDCPVCDKGGECPLQDQAFSHGPGESRYVEEKRHYEKPIPISELVFLDRERCILCDRCTRFADEVAGDPLISFTHRGNNTQVLTFPDEPFASYFSGNTVQICPVGALTAKPYRFKARPWDLEQDETTCTTCSVGCRMAVQSSRDELVRHLGVDSDPVNWGWLCDRGRFNFEAVNNDEARLSVPLRRQGDEFVAVSWSDALEDLARVLRHAAPGTVAVLGGARGTNEDAWAWSALCDAAGITMRDAQLADGLPADVYALPQATLDSACAARTVVLLAPDLKEELPVLHLRLRHAAEKRGTRIVEVSSRDTGLTAHAWRTFRHEPGRSADAVAAMLADPDVSAALAEGPTVIVVGRANLAESADFQMAAIASVLDAVPAARVLPVNRRGNVRGALTLGLAPRDGADAATILSAGAKGSLEALILLGADPIADTPDADLARRGISGARFVVSLDTHMSASSRLADLVLPASAFAEKAGTTTNLEGRVTDVAARVTAHGTSRPDWMVAVELASMLGHDLGVSTVGEVTARIAASAPGFDVMAVGVDVRRDGAVVSAPAVPGARPAMPDVPERNSYDFRLVVGRQLYDGATGTANSPSLAGLARGSVLHLHPLDADRVGVAAGAMVKVSNAQGSLVVPVAADQSTSRGTAYLAHNQGGPDPRELVSLASLVTDVRVESL